MAFPKTAPAPHTASLPPKITTIYAQYGVKPYIPFKNKSSQRKTLFTCPQYKQNPQFTGEWGAAEKTDLQRTSIITFFIGNHLSLKGKPARKEPSTSINSSLSPTSCLDPEAAAWPHPYLSDGNGQIVKKLISTCPSLTSPFKHGVQ